MRRKKREERERDLERELRSDLELEIEERRERGLPRQQAHYASVRSFGNMALIQEQVRDTWRSRWLEAFLHDSLYALRLFRRAPGFTATIILTLALGIGANTAVFTVFQAVLLQPLRYRNPERMVAIWGREIHAKGTSKLFDLYTDYENWKQHSRTLEGVTAVSWAPQASPSRVLTGRGHARTVLALPVTPDFFSFLGVAPQLGRIFDAGDSSKACSVVLTDSFWENTLGRRRSAIGETLRLDDKACTILGVMPPDFAFLPPEAPVAMWTILPQPAEPAHFAVAVFARLKPGVSVQAAQADILALQRQAHEHDRLGRQVEPVVYNLHEEFTWLTGRNLRLTLVVLFAAVCVILLICCVNVANLLLGRFARREREMALRAALGCGQGRLLRQLLTENLLIALAASLVGAGIAAAAVGYFRAAHPIEMPPGTVLELNVPVLGFTACLGILTALLFGLVPAWRASRSDLNESLRSGGKGSSQGRRHRGFGKALIVAEVSLTLVLLASAGLLIQTIQRFASAPLGFNPDGLWAASLPLPKTGYKNPERRRQLYERVRAALSGIPGIEAVALSSARPLGVPGSVEIVEVQGRPEPRVESVYDTHQQTVSADYFRVMKTPLMAGRFFDGRDRADSEPVVIVNESLVRKYFAAEEAVGKYVRPFSNGKESGPWRRIVGVVADEKVSTVYQEVAWVAEPVMYRPLDQDPPGSMNLIVRAEVENSTIAAGIERTVAGIDPDIPVEEVQTVRELEAKMTAYPRFRALLLGSFAALGLILALVGLFGVLSHLVTQRTQEIGIRIALGARGAAVLSMILKEGLVLSGTGVAVGLAAAWALGRYYASLLYGVRPTDPVLLLGVSLVLLVAALAAMYLPARRASRIDPITALKYE